MGIGVDIVELSRLDIENERFVRHILSDEEYEIFQSFPTEKRKREYLGGRFAAKEAYLKANHLGIGGISFHDIVILNHEDGSPYLNDEDACARQFEFLYQESRSSVRQITIKLRQRGFDNNLIRECIPADTFEREKAAALRVLAMKYKPSADRQKMMANLYSKGFDSSAIRAAVAEFAADDSD